MAKIFVISYKSVVSVLAALCILHSVHVNANGSFEKSLDSLIAASNAFATPKYQDGDVKLFDTDSKSLKAKKKI